MTLAIATLVVGACDDKDGSVSNAATTTGDDAESTSTGPSSGSESGTSGGEPSPLCEQNETVIGLAQESIVGLTPAQIIDDAAGLYVGSLQWSDEGVPVGYTGALGPVAVEIEITHDGGEARSVAGELIVGCGHEGPCPCPDSLEVDVGLRFATADGVFAEQLDAELVYTVDDSGFTAAGLGVRLRFQPDETAGTLSSAELTLLENFELQYLEFDLQPHYGALSGSVNAVAEGMGVFGAGRIASLGAVRGVGDCSGFIDAGSGCGLANCVEVLGQPVYGEAPDTCSCGASQAYCFSAALEGEPAPALYTRQIEGGFEAYDEVVEFPVTADLGGPWRACADAPEVLSCGCLNGC